MTDKPSEELVAEAKAKAAEPSEPVTEITPPAPEPAFVVSGAITRLLVETRPEFLGALSVMIASRQLYVMAMRDLEVNLDALNDDARKKLASKAISLLEEPEVDVSGVDALEAFQRVETTMVQAAANQAQQPFNEEDLFRSMRESVFPWMLNVTKKHKAVELEELRRNAAADDQARQARKVPIGIRIDNEGNESLERKRSLTLVGWRPAVLYVLDQIVNHTLAANEGQLYQVLRFMTGKIKTSHEPHRQLCRIGEKMWENCTESATSLARLLQQSVVDGLNDSLDLWVVDDLSAAHTAGLSVVTPGFCANAAHKQFRRSANEFGAAFVGGILLDDRKIQPLVMGNWELLRTHTTLRLVSVTEADDTYLIRVGVEAPAFKVNKDVLDLYGGSNLILPG